jgi:type IV pilus assembly protein PilO
MNPRPWYQYLLFVGVAGLLAYLVYFKPNQAELQSLRTERAQIEEQLSRLQSQKRQMDKIQAELVQLNKTMTELEPLIPRKKETGEILRNVQQLAYDSQLDVIHFQSDRETTKDYYTELPIPVEIVGSYHNLGAFFERMGKFPRIFNIEDFIIRALPGQTAESTISATFTAKTYFFLDISQIKKPEKPKPAKLEKEKDEKF